MTLSRRAFLATVPAAALSAAPLALFSPPLRAEETPYRVADFDWTDPVRARPVPVRLYLPDTATPQQPVPLVVFSHGLGGSRLGYSYLGSHWARQGLASLHLQHVGSDRSLWSGSPLTIVSRLQDAARDSEAIARVNDLKFALDQVLAGPLGTRLDASRLIAAGHSYGANTTLLACGARVERVAASMELRDPRVKVAIVISAPPFYGEPSLQTILAPVRVPSLHITSTEDIIRVPGYYSAVDDRLAVYEATGSPRKTLAVFSGGSHSMFTDRAGTGGVALNPQVKDATRELTTAFLRSVLEQEHAGLQEWPRRHAGIVAKFVNAGPAA